jgi:hypothetical protein
MFRNGARHDSKAAEWIGSYVNFMLNHLIARTGAR